MFHLKLLLLFIIIIIYYYYDYYYNQKSKSFINNKANYKILFTINFT